MQLFYLYPYNAWIIEITGIESEKEVRNEKVNKMSAYMQSTKRKLNMIVGRFE